jgi:hypothetical protein
MLRTSLIAAGVTLGLAFPAFAQTTEYYVVQDTSTKKCTIVDKRPTTQTTVMVGNGVFKTRTEAEAGCRAPPLVSVPQTQPQTGRNAR